MVEKPTHAFDLQPLNFLRDLRGLRARISHPRSLFAALGVRRGLASHGGHGGHGVSEDFGFLFFGLFDRFMARHG